jgi:hypothetical protein
MARRAYRRFSKEFKLEAIRLANESGKPAAQVARELGIRVVIIPFLTVVKSRGYAAASIRFGGKPPLALLGRS